MSEQRRRFWDQPRVTPSTTAQMRSFMQAASAVGFQTRYIGEDLWWPVSNEEVARTLGVYEADLVTCLEKMIDGAVLSSPVAEFRIASAQSAANPHHVVAA